MKFIAARWQVALLISCTLALSLGGCALSSSSGSGGGTDDEASDYEVMAAVAAEAISARLVEEGVDQTLADEISSLTADVAVSAAEESEASESQGGSARRRSSAASSSSPKATRLFTELGGGFVATLVTLESQLPVDVPADELVSAVAEVIAQLPSHEDIAPFLEADEDAADVMEGVTAEMLPTAALLGLISEAEMAAFIAKFGESAFAGLAESGYIDDTAAAEKALERLIEAATGALGTLYSSSAGTTLDEAIEKLSEGVVKGIQRFPAVATHIDLDKAFEVITASGVVGLLGAGMSDSQVGAFTTTFVSGLTQGALGGLTPTGGGSPAFSASQVSAALNSCGAFLSAAFGAAATSANVDLSTLSGSGTQILSVISTTLAGFSTVPGVSVPSNCTVSVTAPSSGTGGGGGTGSACTASTTPFVGTGVLQSVGMTMNLNGSSLVRLAQGFMSPSSATSLASIQVYGKVTSGTPTVSVYVLSSADMGNLSSATPKGTFAPTSTSVGWVSVPLSQSVPLTLSTNYMVVFSISGGAFEFRRGFPSSSVAADSLIHPGTTHWDTGTGLAPVNATRGDDIDIQLFGCQ